MNLRGKKRGVLWAGAMLLLVAAVLVALLPAAREPVYQGRKLGVWLDAVSGGNPQIAPTSAVASVQAVGADALPWLLAELEARDWQPGEHPFREALGLRPLQARQRESRARTGLVLLGDAALPVIPELVSRLSNSNRSVSARFALDAIAAGPRSHLVNGVLGGLTNVVPPASSNAHAAVLEAFLGAVRGTSEWASAESLYALGMYSENAAQILPVILPRTRDKSIWVRRGALWALGRLAREPVPVIPELIRALDDSDVEARRMAAWALGQYYRQAKTAVPRLLQARNDPDPSVKKAANEALEKIDPETAAAIPDLPPLKR